MTSSELTGRVAHNTRRFREQMTAAGFTLAGDDHPIAPVMLGDARLASNMADAMLGMYAAILALLREYTGCGVSASLFGSCG